LQDVEEGLISDERRYGVRDCQVFSNHQYPVQKPDKITCSITCDTFIAQKLTQLVVINNFMRLKGLVFNLM
jgi:hypothetical protein